MLKYFQHEELQVCSTRLHTRIQAAAWPEESIRHQRLSLYLLNL